MTYEYDAAVVIGRFQPFHLAHLELVKQALKLAKQVIIVVGSHRAAPNIKNPFSFEDRKDMIELCFTLDDLYRISIVSVRDYYYNDDVWKAEVLNKVGEIVPRHKSIVICGNVKDSSSYYLSLFPQWQFQPIRSLHLANQDATTIRNEIFSNPNPAKTWVDANSGDWKAGLHKNVADWIIGHFMETSEFTRLQEEHKFLSEYRESWKAAPYAPTFVTADTVLFYVRHVLLVERAGPPGKGLYALPGGFIRPNESVYDASVRELREETAIDLKDYGVTKPDAAHVFDHPDRSLRGRTITHAFCHHLFTGSMPETEASDDASRAFWHPCAELAINEDKFFEDHLHIINYFMFKG